LKKAISHKSFLPYGKQTIDNDDISSVVEALSSPLITTGPLVETFECALANYVKSHYAVALSSGTAALHAAMFAAGVGPGDEVIVPPLTFVATANAIIYQGGTPVFVDVNRNNLLLDPSLIEQQITSKTKAILAVDYAGHPCNYTALKEIAEKNKLLLIADSCHALGSHYQGVPCGSLADMTVFSFHPLKAITTAEGGMLTTNNPELADRARQFRNHGFNQDHRQRTQSGSLFSDMTNLGYNYRLSDIQCALGLSQLKKLPLWIEQRQKIAASYQQRLKELPQVKPLEQDSDISHSYHLFVVRLAPGKQLETYQNLRSNGIGASVHYKPVHLHPYYEEKFADQAASCPVAEEIYTRILSLPIFPGMTDKEIENVIISIRS